MFSDGPPSQPQHSLFAYPLVLQTTNVDEAASLLATSAVPYRSELLTPASSFQTQIYGTSSPRIHMSRVRTSGAMRVKAQLPGDSYAIVLSVWGDLEHRAAGDLVRVSSKQGLVQSPWQAVEVKTPPLFELLFLRLGREFLTAELRKLLNSEVRAPLVFSPAFNLSTHAGQQFRQSVVSLCAQLRQTEGHRKNLKHKEPRPGLDQLENEIVSLLLESQPHNYRRLLSRNAAAAPWQVRAAEEYISANAHLSLTLGDICLAAGVNSRTLQHSFLSKRRYSPMQFLRRVRMERVRADLSRPGGKATVTEVASSWGFLHFGRFASEYHARFGEKPSETLQRSRK